MSGRAIRKAALSLVRKSEGNGLLKHHLITDRPMSTPSQRNSRRRIFALPLLCLMALWLAGCSEDKTPETDKPPEAMPRNLGQAMKNIWREIVEPIMAAEGIAPPTAEQRQQMRDMMRSMLGGGSMRATPAVERVEQLQLRYECRSDSVELELPDTDLPPVRMRRQN